MVCPQCNKEMKQGYVQSMKEIIYTDKPYKLFSILRKPHIKLTKNKITPATCEGWHCPWCKIVVVPY